MKGTLIKNNEFGSMTVKGDAIELPTVGHRFCVVGLVNTSTVQEVWQVKPGKWEFKTHNSFYMFSEDELA